MPISHDDNDDPALLMPPSNVLPGTDGSPLIVDREGLFHLLFEAAERGQPFDLQSVVLRESDLVAGRFFNADFSECLGVGYDFTSFSGRARYPSISFCRAILDRACLSSCHFTACLFREVSLRGANLSTAVFDCNRPEGFLYADLAGANLSLVSLDGADLRGACLVNVQAHRAYLAYNNFRWANLSGADLSGADLRCCDFGYANLSQVRFEAALIDGADFANANLEGSDLERMYHERGERSYVFVQWRHKDDMPMPPPSPRTVLNHPYNHEMQEEEQQQPTSPWQREEDMLAEYARYVNEHGVPLDASSQEIALIEEEERRREREYWRQRRQRRGLPPDPTDDEDVQAHKEETYEEAELPESAGDAPFLPDFPDD